MLAPHRNQLRWAGPGSRRLRAPTPVQSGEIGDSFWYHYGHALEVLSISKLLVEPVGFHGRVQGLLFQNISPSLSTSSSSSYYLSL